MPVNANSTTTWAESCIRQGSTPTEANKDDFCSAIGARRINSSFIVPVFSSNGITGDVSGATFSSFFNSAQGTLRLRGSRSLASGLGTLASFNNSTPTAVGPAIYDNLGALQVRIRSSSGGDAINYNLPTRATTYFDIVISWETANGAARSKVWLNGIEYTADIDVLATALATNQVSLSWGETSLTGVIIDYFDQRVTGPYPLGYLADKPTSNPIWNPLSSSIPTAKGQMTLEFTSNTVATIRGMGTDGVVRSATIPLA